MVENISKPEEDGNKKVILPIFYNVKPDDVKLKTDLYSKAISELEQKMEDQKKKFGTEEVETWRQALKEVDAIQGLELEKYEGDGDLSKSVVEEVVNRLQTRHRKVTERFSWNGGTNSSHKQFIRHWLRWCAAYWNLWDGWHR
ncbi:uncharacterized protein LOC120286250 [Eucalyptus grandis]|uniref:uncharacterized protein LOC120286250 n=1 Tax=Eucalyptus grandis TaxID=71139 RepID=UPI00192EC0BA|nr:uncharacterized protein LOC120286250 [Eucalyptus grandis]